VQEQLNRVRSYYHSRGRDELTDVTAKLLSELASRVVRPLQANLENAQAALEVDASRVPATSAAATVRTNTISQWPTAGVVPSRFGTAVNEVLLEDVDAYGALFDRHLVADVGQANLAPADAVRLAGAQVIALVEAPDRLASEVVSVRGLNGVRVIDGLGTPARLGRLRTWWPTFLPSGTAAQAAYEPQFAAPALLETARSWVSRSNTDFGAHLQEGLKSHLTNPDIGTQQLLARQEDFLRKFDTALRVARPLANYSQGQLERLHNPAAINLSLQLSEIPLAGSPFEARVKELLLGFGNVNQTELSEAFHEIFTTNEQRNRIDIIDANPPLSPLALISLQQPIRERWQSAQASRQMRQTFWQWRRSRGLIDFVPVLPTWLEAMVLGWLVGRLVGDVTIPKETQLAAARVWDGETRSWRSFLNPLLGLEWQQGEDAWTLLAALLESMPLAMARTSGDTEFADLVPYRALRDLGLAESAGMIPALYAWTTTGVGLGSAPSGFMAQYTSASAEDRVAAASVWVEQVCAQYQKLLPKGHGDYLPGSDLAELTVHNFNEITAPSAWEIAPIIVSAGLRLRAALNNPAYTGNSGGGRRPDLHGVAG
jgi:hypothetical protein